MKAINRTFLLALMSMLMFAACKSQGASGSKKAAASDFSLEIIHSGCRGYCPAYTIKVNGSGDAQYNGRRSVDMIGDYVKTLDTKTFESIVNAYEDANFFDFDDAYGAEAADVPAVITTVKLNGKTKRVNDVRNGPKALKELEAKVEALIGTDGWDKKD